MPLVDLVNYSRFYCVHINCTRENWSRPTCSSEPSRVPLKELSHVFKKNRKLRRLSWERISKNIPKLSKIHCYTRSGALNDVNKLRERTRIKYRSKGKCCKHRKRSERHLLQETYEHKRKRKHKRKAAKSNKKIKLRLYRISRPGVFRDLNHRTNYCKFLVVRPYRNKSRSFSCWS